MINAFKTNFYFRSTLFAISILWIMWILLTYESLLPALLISAVNTMLILYALLSKYFQHIIFRIFFAYHTLTLVLPIFWITVGYPSSEITVYFNLMGIDENDLYRSNLIILMYDTVLITVAVMIQKFHLIKKRTPKIFKYYLSDTNKYLSIIIITLIAYIMKLYLISIGTWFMYNQVDLTQHPFANTAIVLQQLDVLVLLYFSFIYKHIRSKKMLLLMVGIISISIFFALISTSKTKLFIVLIPLVLLLMNTKLNKVYFIVILLFFFNSNILFEYFSYSRQHNNISLLQNIENFSHHTNSSTKSDTIRNNALIVRLGYQFALAKAIKTYNTDHFKYKLDYLNNFIGLLPRAIWPGKPVMGINGNKIGHDIGLLTKYDEVTSVGITPLGEAFYELGYWGVVLVPIFIGALITYMSLILNVQYWISYLLSIMLGLSLSTVDWYNALIPGLVKYFLIFYLFSLLLNRKFADEIKLKVKLK